MEPVFEVLAPGLLTTVQDAGRRGYGDLGVPISGACDPWSLAVANALLGNDPDAAALECTLLGPELRVLREVVIAVAGADLQAEIRPTGRRVEPGTTVWLHAGEVLVLPAPADTGARAYVAIPGGVDVPLILGSRSTCLVAGFGGLDGRALRAGDLIGTLDPRSGTSSEARERQWSGWTPITPNQTIRIVPGPDATSEIVAALTARPWVVSQSSDRRGIRLTGEALTRPPGGDERPTTGVLPGTIQLPPNGQPIVLLADAQPTGGYPVIAVVIEADLPVVGQLVAPAGTRFDAVTADGAREADRARRAAFDAGVTSLRA